MADRTYVHEPNAIAANKPVILSQYATIASLAEKEFGEPARVIPMVIRRIISQETETQIGTELLTTLLEHDQLPWGQDVDLLVNTLKGKYGIAGFLGPLPSYENLLNVTRFRGNRVLYRQGEEVNHKRSRGYPKWETF